MNLADVNPATVMSDLVALVRVAEAGSFSATARLHGLTPSAVSRQIARLEKALNLTLLQRNSRHLQLTEAGALVLAQGRQMLAATRAALLVAEDHTEAPRGLVRLSAPKAFARHVLQAPLLSFLKSCPEVDVHLLVEDRLIDPLREGVDVVLRITDEPSQGLVARALGPVRQCVLASPDYLAAHPAIHVPQDLLAHSCLSLGEYEWDRRWRFRRSRVGEPDDTAEIEVQGRITLNHSSMRLDAIAAGLGVGCVPDFVAAKALAAGRVMEVLSDWAVTSPYQGTAWLLYAADRYRAPKVRALVEHLLSTCKITGTHRGLPSSTSKPTVHSQ